MKTRIDIGETQERMKELMIRIKRDSHFLHAFDGTINAGKINGYYTTMSTIGNQTSYVQIKGEYDLDTGKAYMIIAPSNIFWIVSVFCAIATGCVSYWGITDDKTIFLGLIPVVVLLIITFIIYYLESRNFITEIQRLLTGIG